MNELIIKDLATKLNISIVQVNNTLSLLEDLNCNKCANS